MIQQQLQRFLRCQQADESLNEIGSHTLLFLLLMSVQAVAGRDSAEAAVQLADKKKLVIAEGGREDWSPHASRHHITRSQAPTIAYESNTLIWYTNTYCLTRVMTTMAIHLGSGQRVCEGPQSLPILRVNGHCSEPNCRSTAAAIRDSL